MKKIYVNAASILTIALILNFTPMAVQASTANSTVKNQVKVKSIIKAKVQTKTKVETKTKAISTKSKIKTTLKWDKSALKLISNLAFFDYSFIVRNAYVKKVENYARRKKINVITIAVINSIRE